MYRSMLGASAKGGSKGQVPHPECWLAKLLEWKINFFTFFVFSELLQKIAIPSTWTAERTPPWTTSLSHQ
jgi:hypothetical protein